jgi:hypothetical protein
VVDVRNEVSRGAGERAAGVLDLVRDVVRPLGCRASASTKEARPVRDPEMMRKPLSALAVAVTTAGMVLAAPATAGAAERAPMIKRAWVAVDAGQVGVLDDGDVLKLRFTRAVVITDITSVGIQVTGANGPTIRVDNEPRPYGAYYPYPWRGGEVLTIQINLDPAEYTEGPLPYPLTLVDTFNIMSRGGTHLEVSVPGSRDVLID